MKFINLFNYFYKILFNSALNLLRAQVNIKVEVYEFLLLLIVRTELSELSQVNQNDSAPDSGAESV